MTSFLDHVKSCQIVCADLLANYLKPEENFLRAHDDFARGRRNQITLCLLAMSRELEDFAKRPRAFLSNTDSVALRAEFFLTAVGETALKNASDEDMAPPPALEKNVLDRMWLKITHSIETGEHSSAACFENFAAYARGCEEGAREFREVILPAIIRNYQKAMGDVSSPRGYWM